MRSTSRGVVHIFTALGCQSAHSIKNKIDKRSDLCGRVMPRWMIGIEGKRLIRPIRKQLDEAAIFQQISYNNGDDLGDASTCNALREHRPGITNHQSAFRRDGDDFPALVKLPIVGVPSHRVSEVDTGVIDELVRVLRTAMPLQIVWSRNCHHLQVCQLSRDQRGHCRLSKAYGDIHAITH
jgi:hypothetical protein